VLFLSREETRVRNTHTHAHTHKHTHTHTRTHVHTLHTHTLTHSHTYYRHTRTHTALTQCTRTHTLSQNTCTHSPFTTILPFSLQCPPFSPVPPPPPLSFHLSRAPPLTIPTHCTDPPTKNTQKRERSTPRPGIEPGSPA
jgi:hypothetical protein